MLLIRLFFIHTHARAHTHTQDLFYSPIVRSILSALVRTERQTAGSTSLAFLHPPPPREDAHPPMAANEYPLRNIHLPSEPISRRQSVAPLVGPKPQARLSSLQDAASLVRLVCLTCSDSGRLVLGRSGQMWLSSCADVAAVMRQQSDRVITGSGSLLHPSTLNNGLIMVIEAVTGVVWVIPPER